MLASGEQLSHYKIISSIGAGGMGEVYLAEDTKLERQVALKILLPDVADDDERIRRFLLEARSASALNHPNILTVFEIGTYKELQYIATEFIKGDTLRDRMNGEPMKLRETLEITLQVAGALGAAHEAGIIHRDIKPENIMIREDGLVKVLDFGLAKLSGMAAESVDTTLPQFNTQPGVLVGTVAYMSPEQARGRKLDPRSDIFSLGIVMFELFTGQRPFEGEGHLDLISSILKDEAPLLRQVAPKLPQRLERIVEKTLRKDRDHRYQHIKDLFLDIEDLQEELKFEAKLNQSVQPTVVGGAFFTNPSELRSAFRTGISKTRRFTLLHAFFFVAFAATIIGSIWYFGLITGPTAPSPGSYKTTEVATWNSAPGELSLSARFSPDSKMIVFSSTKSGTKNIWLTQTGSTESIQITNDIYANTDPLWSPKGDEIAYYSDRNYAKDGNNMTGIWRISALGGTPKFVGQPSSRGISLRRWTASGKIYYEFGNELFAMKIADGSSEKITSFETAENFDINISPDERSILFLNKKGEDWKIMQSGITGENPSEIIKGTGRVIGIAWLPERKRLFYSAHVDGVLQVFRADVNSRQTSHITASDTDSEIVDASSDGHSVLFSSAKEESNIWRTNTSDAQETVLARDVNSKLWPDVSPDGARIAFQSARNMSQANKLFDSSILVRSSKREENERTSTIAERASMPTWSPDGSTLAYLKNIENDKEIFLAKPDGNSDRRLTQGGIPSPGYSTTPYNYLDVQYFAWSPDGLQIAYITKKNGFPNIWIVSVSDGTETMLTSNNDMTMSFSSLIWSRDRGQLAFSYRQVSKAPGEKPHCGVRIINIAAKEITNIYDSTKVVRGLGWSQDVNYFLIEEMGKFGNASPTEAVIKKCPVSGGQETVIADLKNIYFYNTFLSYDKKSIAFAARNDDKDDLWVIPAAGGPTRKVTNNNDSGVYYSRLAWFHDGSAITFGKQTRFSLLSMIGEIE